MRRVVIMGAGGRDFHNFNVVFRDDPECRVVAFTAAQIPGIDERTYPPSLAGDRYPNGIPIVPEHDLAEIVRREQVDEVVFAYSDVSHEDVMHRASIALAAGADFTLLGPRATMLHVPQASRRGVRDPDGRRQEPDESPDRSDACSTPGFASRSCATPCRTATWNGCAVQRFATLADIDAADPTIEEREEYELPVALGMVMYAGVDYGAIVDAGVGGGRRHRLGRRQQRLPVPRARSPHRRRRPAPRRRRAALPSRRDLPPDGRRRGREQGRRRGAGRGRADSSRPSPT